MGDFFDCVFHHGGKFIVDGTLKYEGETTTLSFDPDVWSYFVVVSVVKSFGYDNFKQLWYCIEGGSVLDNRLEELIDDTGVIHMANLGRINGVVHLYVIHVVSEPEVINMLEYVTNDQGQVDAHGEVQEESEEDGDDVHVDGDVEDMHEGEEDGDVIDVEVEGDGHVEEFHEVEEDVNGVEGVMDDEVDVCSWSTSSDERDVHENNECLEGLVEVTVQCHIDGDINGDVYGNVEVEV
ncbi:hypothetical protein V8G54_003568 [Vigna mungo]|uniref:PB1-like domain-containing protein n=1 Tax=Vigna mungo TaxID=3915 RepID=A0AAQ3SEA1_VIGMU